jgi:hypothetical protein
MELDDISNTIYRPGMVENVTPQLMVFINVKGL